MATQTHRLSHHGRLHRPIKQLERNLLELRLGSVSRRQTSRLGLKRPKPYRKLQIELALITRFLPLLFLSLLQLWRFFLGCRAAACAVRIFNRLGLRLQRGTVVGVVYLIHEADSGYRKRWWRGIPEIQVGSYGVGGDLLEGAVSLWVDATADELPLDVRVPVVLDLVVSSSR